MIQARAYVFAELKLKVQRPISTWRGFAHANIPSGVQVALNKILRDRKPRVIKRLLVNFLMQLLQQKKVNFAQIRIYQA